MPCGQAMLLSLTWMTAPRVPGCSGPPGVGAWARAGTAMHTREDGGEKLLTHDDHSRFDPPLGQGEAIPPTRPRALRTHVRCPDVSVTGATVCKAVMRRRQIA